MELLAALGFQLPSGVYPMASPSAPPPSSLYPTFQTGHSPLGEMLADKVDLLPSVFRTGLYVTGAVLVFKLMAFLLHVSVLRLPKPWGSSFQ